MITRRNLLKLLGVAAGAPIALTDSQKVVEAAVPVPPARVVYPEELNIIASGAYYSSRPFTERTE